MRRQKANHIAVKFGIVPSWGAAVLRPYAESAKRKAKPDRGKFWERGKLGRSMLRPYNIVLREMRGDVR